MTRSLSMICTALIILLSLIHLAVSISILGRFSRYGNVFRPEIGIGSFNLVIAVFGLIIGGFGLFSALTYRRNLGEVVAYACGVLALFTLASLITALIINSLAVEYVNNRFSSHMNSYINSQNSQNVINKIQTHYRCCGTDTWLDWSRIGLNVTTATTTTPVVETTTVPVEETTTTPTEETTTVPAGETTTVPAGETTTVPAGETTTVPAGETTTVPAGETTTVPPGETTTVPAGETTTVPAGETTTAPAGETTTVPAGETTTAPAEETTTVPAGETTTVPAGETTTAPPAEETTVPVKKVAASSVRKRNANVERRGDVMLKMQNIYENVSSSEVFLSSLNYRHDFFQQVSRRKRQSVANNGIYNLPSDYNVVLPRSCCTTDLSSVGNLNNLYCFSGGSNPDVIHNVGCGRKLSKPAVGQTIGLAVINSFLFLILLASIGALLQFRADATGSDTSYGNPPPYDYQSQYQPYSNQNGYSTSAYDQGMSSGTLNPTYGYNYNDPMSAYSNYYPTHTYTSYFPTSSYNNNYSGYGYGGYNSGYGYNY